MYGTRVVSGSAQRFRMDHFFRNVSHIESSASVADRASPRPAYHLASVAVPTLTILGFLVISEGASILSIVRIMSEGIEDTVG